MAGHAADGLVVVKVIAELGHVGVVFVLAVHQLGAKQALLPQPFAQVLYQHRVFRPAFAQDVAHAVQHRQHGGEVVAGFGFFFEHKGLCLVHGHQLRVGIQLVGQRLNAGFAGDHALGAALRLKGQVNVFHLLLGRGGVDGSQQGGRELALFFNAFDHRFLAVAQFAQVAQAGFQLAQLDIVQPVRHFFAVAGDEGHSGAAIQQGHCGLDLLGAYPDFLRNLRDDFLHCEKAGQNR